MAGVIYYASDDEFKISQRGSWLETRDWQMQVVKAVHIGARVSMFKSVEEVVNSKWQTAARGKPKGGLLMVDGIDVTVGDRRSFFREYHLGKTQEEFVNEIFDLIPGEIPERPRIILKSVVAIGLVGKKPAMFVGLLEGNFLFRPKQAWNKNLPAVLPYVYVMHWQRMLASVYGMDWEERQQYVTHDHGSMTQALAWVEETLLSDEKVR